MFWLRSKNIFGLSYCCDICLQFCGRVESYDLSLICYFNFDFEKRHFYKPFELQLNLLNFAEMVITLQSPIQNWPKNEITNMLLYTKQIDMYDTLF